jgi:hypothetical protein
MSRLCPIKPLLRQLGDNAYRASPALISGEPRELRYIALASIERSYSGPMKAGDFGSNPNKSVHTIRNPNTTAPARAIDFLISEKGQWLVIPVK